MADKEQSPDVSSAGSSANNPLSRKLNKILETRLDNDKVKHFLNPLSCRCNVNYTMYNATDCKTIFQGTNFKDVGS